MAAALSAPSCRALEVGRCTVLVEGAPTPDETSTASGHRQRLAAGSTTQAGGIRDDGALAAAAGPQMTAIPAIGLLPILALALAAQESLPRGMTMGVIK
jgi:hypothetical protein